MSSSKASKIIFKRSSILGKRPSNQLQPGEIALNTNSSEPGLFFNTTDGRSVKVGPTAVLANQPINQPEKGETWFDTSNGSLNVGDAENLWRSIAAPYLGGGGNVVFVAPEFKFSSDSPLNDGQTLPFQTLSRAVLEVSKLKIASILSGKVEPAEEEKYNIIIAPSPVAVNNGTGTSLGSFNTIIDESSSDNLSIPVLEQFNAQEGGIILPGGVTLMGIDMRKCTLRPSFVPKYRHPGLPQGLAGTNQALSNILKISGNSSCASFSIKDKISTITSSKVVSSNLIATFISNEPHGFTSNDRVYVSISPDIDQSSGTFASGYYFTRPIDTFKFQLVYELPGENANDSYVKYSSLPKLNLDDRVKFTLTSELKSAHRLTAFRYATENDLADYYTKVQIAFPTFFGGKVVDGKSLVQKGEVTIVAPADNLYPDNFDSNSTANSSCYIKEVTLKSEYGMNLIDVNGDDIKGYRSLITNQCTSVSLQKDPAAYEIYTTVTDPETNQLTQRWWTLLEATYYSLPYSNRPESILDIPSDSQLQILNQTAIENIRYHYKTLSDGNGNSFGLTDINDDFRHYGIRARNSAYIQAQSVYTIGCATGVWSTGGAYIHLTNSTTNFGSIAFKAEGFRGINTIGGAYPNAKGFQFNGIQRPLALSLSQVLDKDNKKILSLGSRIIQSEVDPNNPAIQLLTLSSNFLPYYILPYSLKAGSAIWVSSKDVTYRGFLATDGGPTVLLGSDSPGGQTAKLRIRYSDSTIPVGEGAVSSLEIPYIRRFVDPRKPDDRSYQFVVSNTSTDAVAPSVGSVLRLNQTGQNLGVTTLRPNVQLDPGPLGGWGRLFTVDSVKTGQSALSPNYNYVTGNSTQDNKYLVTLTVSDIASPWVSGKEDNFPQGSYCTFANKIWYTAENSLWDSVYYDTTFDGTTGPYKLAPVEESSPFVPANVLERQEPVSNSYQGSYGADSALSTLTGDSLAEYLAGTYFRGSTFPYTEYSIQNYFDGDDGSDDMGLLLKVEKSEDFTFLVSPINQSALVPQVALPPEYGSLRPKPTLIEFFVLSSALITNPKQNISILRLEQGTKYEYMQVVALTGTRVIALRLNSSNSRYPDPSPMVQGEDIEWNVSSVDPVKVYPCEASMEPDIRAYDPLWSSTKLSVLRFFEVMGYPRSAILPYLSPKYWGERFFAITSLGQSPGTDGYALTTAQWPLEFNQPSTIIANTHTWAYCGYPFYSQGLPRHQTNDISKKLSYDFLSTATWSGRVTITGVNDRGEIVSFGPQREAITSQYYKSDDPEVNLATQQIFIEQPYIEYPGQIVAYTADSISDMFDGETYEFNLTRGGLAIPTSHINANSMWVQLGGVTQKPGLTNGYSVTSTSIVFTEPPQQGSHCDIRIITSEDEERTLTVVPLSMVEPMETNRSIFTLIAANPNDDLSKLDINSQNTIVNLGGVEQLPNDAYTISRVGPQSLQITFTGVPQLGSSVDIRAICSGRFWSAQSIYPVKVHSLDSITPQFSNPGQTTFLLKYQNKPVNPSIVTSENLIVSIGGALQVPSYQSGGNTLGSYSLGTDSLGRVFISFSEKPANGATSDIRIVTSAEALPSIENRGKSGSFLKWGPSLVLDLAQNVEDLMEG